MASYLTSIQLFGVSVTVIKLTSSGKGIQVIDDEGNVFQTSKLYVETLLAGNIKGNFILLNRLPWKAAEDRFKKSPLWEPKTGVTKEGLVASDSTTTDVLSVKGRETVKQAEQVAAAEEYKL